MHLNERNKPGIVNIARERGLQEFGPLNRIRNATRVVETGKVFRHAIKVDHGRESRVRMAILRRPKHDVFAEVIVRDKSAAIQMAPPSASRDAVRVSYDPVLCQLKDEKIANKRLFRLTLNDYVETNQRAG